MSLEQIKQEIVRLKEQRSKLEEKERIQKEQDNDTRLNQINNEIAEIKSTISAYTIKKREHEHAIEGIEKIIKQYGKTIKNLEVEKCPIVGHYWDYRYDKDDHMEEVCAVCGTWRDD